MKLPRWASLRPVVPQNWDTVTPEWMTEALRKDHPDAVVSKVNVLTRDDGTNRRARFGLEYSSGRGPRQVFVKAHAPSHRFVHFRNGNLFNEARLFANGTHIPLDHPHVYLAVPDYPRLDFLLVMEDLTLRGADPRDATRPMNVDQVASGLRGLAALHSRYWDFSKASHPKLGWVKQWTPSQGWQVGLRRRVPIGLSRAGEAMPPSVRSMTGDNVVDLWASNVTTLAQGPQTLLHGDAHIGNTYVLPGDETGFLDWQVVRRGSWIQDVGYFLVGSLTVEDRRVHERALLEIYRDALRPEGSQVPTSDEIWHRYRQSPSYGLAIWLSTLGTDGWQRHEVSLALAERYAAALDDLETLEITA
jgi:hypothetical protein